MIIVKEIVLPETAEQAVILAYRPEPTGIRFWNMQHRMDYQQAVEIARHSWEKLETCHPDDARLYIATLRVMYTRLKGFFE